MAKRILRELKLDKIAAVDRPCQEHATMAILKRDFSADERQAMADKGEAMADGSYPIANVADLENAIQSFGRAKNKGAVKAHIKRRAKALGAEDKLPDSWSSAAVAKSIYGAISSNDQPTGAQSFADLIAAQEEQQRQCDVSQELWPYFDALTNSIRSIVADITMDEAGKINAMRQSIDQFTEAVTAAVPDAEDEIEKLFTDPAASGVFHAGYFAGDRVSKEKSMTDNTQKVADLEKSVADLTKRAEKAEADLAKANAELTTEKAKVADLTKSADIAKNDEVLKVGETEVRKSAVGEASFAFMKAQQAEIQKARDEADMERLQKRAETEIGHLPGEAIAKAKVLKAIGGMGEEDRKVLDAMLKAGEAAIAKGFSTFGVSPRTPTGSDDPTAKLDSMAKARAAKDGTSYAKAYDEVLKTTEGQALYAESRKPAAA
jgi:hypothetical protein